MNISDKWSIPHFKLRTWLEHDSEGDEGVDWEQEEERHKKRVQDGLQKETWNHSNIVVRKLSK